MKPKDLKASFKFSEREIILEDNVLHVPVYSDYQFEFDAPTFFGNTHPIHLEYCSGNGHWLIAQAKKNPLINYIAVEKRFERVKKIWSKMKNEGLSNVLIVCGLAEDFTKHFLKPDQIDGIFVHFPDPYPKNRHRKHRLFKLDFVQKIAKVVKMEKNIVVVTDDQTYSKTFVNIMLKSGQFISEYEKPFYKVDLSYDFSYFLDLWKSKDKTIFHFKFRRRNI